MLIGLPLLGNFHVVDALDAEGERLVEELYTAMVKSKYTSNKATYLSWVKYFKDGMGKESPCQLAAFFAYWLSYLAFLSPPEDALNSFVFPITALPAQKKPVALGPWFLGSLYPARRVCRSVRSVTC